MGPNPNGPLRRLLERKKKTGLGVRSVGPVGDFLDFTNARLFWSFAFLQMPQKGVNINKYLCFQPATSVSLLDMTTLLPKQ